jgi:hypothetical protein
MASRPYTGNKDPQAAKREGTKVFLDYMCFLFGVKSLGIYANRPMRSGNGLSVHATWRAVDASGTKEQRTKMIEFLFAHRDALGVEEIHSYDGTAVPLPNLTKYGAGYRCDRDGWKRWDEKSNGGTPGASWVHYEISPLMADHPDLVHQAMKKIFGQ